MRIGLPRPEPDLRDRRYETAVKPLDALPHQAVFLMVLVSAAAGARIIVI